MKTGKLDEIYLQPIDNYCSEKESQSKENLLIFKVFYICFVVCIG